MPSVFDHVDRIMVQQARELMGTILDARALVALEQQPTLLEPLLAMRGHGRMELTKDLVVELVRLGFVTADRDGYYLTDIVEDFLDEVIRRLRLKEE